jgi:hypothetical protein
MVKTVDGLVLVAKSGAKVVQFAATWPPPFAPLAKVLRSSVVTDSRNLPMT